ncbi:MAG: 6-bladed beta-propeller [Candidatus Aminicenantes bacterium]|nr:6-bladed beta-propeller [Candidatus Aminicenantes bacterium]
MRKATPSAKPGAYFLAALVLLSFITMLSAQVVENPAKPKAKNAGRVVAPEEVLAISDEGTSDYYFKRPRSLGIAPDGSLLLIDENQVLRFDKDGKFGRNFFKKGQGPGEVTYVSACLATDKNVIVHSTYPNKLIFFDYSGKYEREILVGSLPGSGRTQARILLAHGGDYLLRAREFPQPKGGDPYYMDIPQMILTLNDATGEPKTLTTFMTKAFAVAAPGGGGGSYDITDLIVVPFKEMFLALTHTEEYLLKIFDPVGNKIIREFRRTYKRVKPEPLTEEQKKGSVLIGNKRFGPPELEYQNDVKNILARGDEIWAVTSTKDKTKGVLIDVFDGEGVYRDCFWLKLPEAALKSVLSPGQCALDGDFLWVVERSEGETFAIKKYRIMI